MNASLPTLFVASLAGALFAESLPSRIAFGSCSSQDKPQPILKSVVKDRPDLFIYLGDNIYGDTEDMTVLSAKYQKLADIPEFQALRKSTPLLAVWDDHDYGRNDAGKEYPKKEESAQIFLDFWQVPADSPRRQHEGIYGVETFSDGQHTLQVILLDTRTFREPLLENDKKPPHKNDYRPDPSPEKTLLGAAQWKWLEEVLREPADLRIVASSIQFGHEYNGWESWTNLPAEQERFLQLIRDTEADGVLFLSGDVHWGEISIREDLPGLYPIIDVTSSGLTNTWPTLEDNKYRYRKAMREVNYGMIKVDWQKPDPVIELTIRDFKGRTEVKKVLKLSELSLPKN